MSASATRPPGRSRRAASAKAARLVGAQVDHAVRDHRVGARRRQAACSRACSGSAVTFPNPALVRRAGPPSASCGVGHVDSGRRGPAAPTCTAAADEIRAGAAAEVHDRSRPRAGRPGRRSARRRRTTRPRVRGSRSSSAAVVAQPLRPGRGPSRSGSRRPGRSATARYISLTAPLEQRLVDQLGCRSSRRDPADARRRPVSDARTLRLGRLPRRDRPVDLQGLRRPRAPTPTRWTSGSPTGSGVRFARVLADLQGGPASELRVAVGRDMRLSAPSMAEAYARGIADEGATSSTSGWSAPRCSTGRSARASSTAG